MTASERRRQPRYDSLNLSYVLVDEAGSFIEQGVGRTLNVSESGLCLETNIETNTRQSLLLTIALEDELIELKGKIIYCKAGSGAMFETGVAFTEISEKDAGTLQEFIRIFQTQ